MLAFLRRKDVTEAAVTRKTTQHARMIMRQSNTRWHDRFNGFQHLGLCLWWSYTFPHYCTSLLCGHAIPHVFLQRFSINFLPFAVAGSTQPCCHIEKRTDGTPHCVSSLPYETRARVGYIKLNEVQGLWIFEMVPKFPKPYATRAWGKEMKGFVVCNGFEETNSELGWRRGDDVIFSQGDKIIQ